MNRKAHLKSIAKKIPAMDYLSPQEYVAAIYQVMKKEVPNYTYLLFAEDLGFSTTNVVRLMLAGKRALTEKTAIKIAKALGLTGDERRFLILLAAYGQARKPHERESLFQEILALKVFELPEVRQKKALEYFSQWYNPVVRELVTFPDFRPSIEWIASRLYTKIAPKEIRKSLKLLEELGLIHLNTSTKKFEISEEQVRPDRQVGNIAAVRYHQKMIEIARESITLVPSKRRDINSITLNVTDATADLIKEKIRNLCEELLELERMSGSGDQIYQVNIQLFPFTK